MKAGFGYAAGIGLVLVYGAAQCLELGAQHVGLKVFDRARLAVGAVVEQRVEPPVL